MKKLILGMMLIVGSLLFASDRAEDTFLMRQDKKLASQERSSDTYLSRDVQDSLVEELSEESFAFHEARYHE